MTSNTSRQELDRVKRFAHACFGFQLSDSKALDVLRVTYGSTMPVIAENWPPCSTMRAIAKCWRCCQVGGEV